MHRNLLRSFLFRDLSDGERDFAYSFFGVTERIYRKGELLRMTGDAFYTFGVVKTGSIQVYMEDIDGNRMMMASVGDGDSFGESLAYLHTDQSPVSIYAAADTTVLWLSPEGVKNAVTPLEKKLAHRFTALLAIRALAQNERIQILSKSGIRARLVTFFTQCEHRYQSKTFRIPFDRAALAVYLAVDRSALSRELSRMKKEGIVDFYKDSFRILR